MHLVHALNADGLGVTVDVPADRAGAPDALLSIEVDDVRVMFAVVNRLHAPYRNELPRLHSTWESLRPWGVPLLVAPSVGPTLGKALTSLDWSWADSSGSYDLRAPGLRLRQRLPKAPSIAVKRTLPKGTRSTALVRWLLSVAELGKPLDPQVLRRVARISQPRVSQILRRLFSSHLLSRNGRKYVLQDVEPLLDAFLRDYIGPGGSEDTLYSLAHPNELATKAVAALPALASDGRLAFSADVGPDVLAPRRGPTHAIVYARATLPLKPLGLVEAQGRADANVLLRIPTDTSVFDVIQPRRFTSVDLPLVDVPQMIWDLHDLGGDDRVEATEELRRWFIKARETS